MEKSKILAQTVKREIFHKLPLVELLGQHRVLIENHLGVTGYSTEEIQIRVNFGRVSVFGIDLRFMQISREQLVITGKITGISLQGR